LKKLILGATLAFGFVAARGQFTKSEIEMVQTLWGKGKHQLTAEVLQISFAETTVFNNIFQHQLLAHNKLGIQRMELIKGHL
jgi:hypothetical protein